MPFADGGFGSRRRSRRPPRGRRRRNRLGRSAERPSRRAPPCGARPPLRGDVFGRPAAAHGARRRAPRPVPGERPPAHRARPRLARRRRVGRPSCATTASRCPSGSRGPDAAARGQGAYRAPEIEAALRACGPQIDVFALGVMLFMTLFATPPFERPCSTDSRYVFVQERRVADMVRAGLGPGSAEAALVAGTDESSVVELVEGCFGKTPRSVGRWSRSRRTRCFARRRRRAQGVRGRRRRRRGARRRRRRRGGVQGGRRRGVEGAGGAGPAGGRRSASECDLADDSAGMSTDDDDSVTVCEASEEACRTRPCRCLRRRAGGVREAQTGEGQVTRERRTEPDGRVCGVPVFFNIYLQYSSSMFIFNIHRTYSK